MGLRKCSWWMDSWMGLKYTHSTHSLTLSRPLPHKLNKVFGLWTVSSGCLWLLPLPPERHRLLLSLTSGVLMRLRTPFGGQPASAPTWEGHAGFMPALNEPGLEPKISQVCFPSHSREKAFPWECSGGGSHLFWASFCGRNVLESCGNKAQKEQKSLFGSPMCARERVCFCQNSSSQ